MPLPVVLVDITPPEAPPALIEALVQACTNGLTEGECRRQTAEAGAGQAVAQVTWERAHTPCARVVVTLRHTNAENGRAERTARVCFDGGDARSERWRAAGFTVATLADPALRDAAYGTDAGQAPRRSPPPPVESESVDRAWGSWLGLAWLAGPGLDDGVWRSGARVSATQSLGALPVFASGSFRWTVRLGDEPVAARWMGGSLGLGAGTDLGFVHLGLRLELLVENLEVSASHDSTGATDAGGRWVPGFLTGLSARWPAEGPLSLQLGADIWRLRDGTRVTVLDQRTASWPALGWTLAAGAELRLR